ncbi:hypothetical protein [Rhizobium sp. Root1220]|uniref:hypothetical protein n=1 Tax=Rhizobium sp. Root1220 TaxID=1736432 RepID=UPI000701B718|nr:hypothetical protein [Rhizobium sp. Root1220]KQV79992.1 hypothetical protein ASC90_25660 [Rhizobium sp. Root1220]
MIDDVRKAWLRGAYLDRIPEVAQHYAADHSHFVDSEWEAFIGDEFEYLTELSADDHSYLRDQAGLEAFRRIVSALSAAREEAFGKLIVDNADVIQSDARFALDLGWISLLHHAADRVRTYPEAWGARIVGAKEKFGCCVLHVACDYSARGCRSEVERLREEVRLRSLATCEVCGASGRLRLSGYAKTVCDQHALVMGEFREDDGMHADPWAWNDDADYIRDVLDKGRALIAEAEHRNRQNCDEYPPEAAEILKDLVPVRPRPKDHMLAEGNDPFVETELGKRIDADFLQFTGREQELLLEFGWHIQDATQGACVKEEYLDKYVRDEVAQWREFSAQPLSVSDEKFLHGYLRGLIDEEYERIRLKQEAERDKD